MLAEAVDWLPAAAMLLSGVILGVMLVWSVARSGSRDVEMPSEAPLAVRDLAAKRDSLITQLRELEDSSGKLPVEELDVRRTALEIETAKTLQELDRMGALQDSATSPEVATVSTASPVSTPLTPDPSTHRGEGKPEPKPAPGSMRGFLWGVGTSVGLVLLILFVYRSSSNRQADQPMTGNVPASGPAASAMTPRQPPAPPDARVTELESRVAREPDNLEARLDLASLQIQRQQLIDVWNQTRYVLERQPKNARALAYQAVVRLEMGNPDEAVRMLREATAADPELLEASVYLAIVYTQLGRSREAAATIQAAATKHPEHRERLMNLLAEMRARAAADPGPSQAAAAPPDAGPLVEGTLEGTIDLAPTARSRVGARAVLFIIARSAGVTSGPPVAVKRIPAATFPMTFSLGTSDSMMGQPLPASIRLEVRADADGDPMTKGPGDPSAALEPVALGSRGLRLILN